MPDSALTFLALIQEAFPLAPNAAEEWTSTEAVRLSWLARVRQHQHQHWQQGKRIPITTYLQHFDPLPLDSDLRVDLIYSEIILRRQLGEDADIDDYVELFPEHAEQLREQILFLNMESVLLSDRVQAPALSVLVGNEDNYTKRSALEKDTTPAELGEKITADKQQHVQTSNIGHANTIEVTHSPPAKLNIPGYRLLEVLGRGGMGLVHKAEQLNLKKTVALKILRAGQDATTEELARFRGEAKTIARLHHPHIIQIFDIGEHDGISYLALEYIDGGSLDQHLQGKPFPPEEAAELVATLGRALQTVHDQGIVHRDLKPANILVEKCIVDDKNVWVPKISDFGLAKDLTASQGYTRTGVIVGTPRYMAPEQLSDIPQKIGPRADIHSLGAILYELLTGRPPFHGNSDWDTLIQVREQEPVSPSRLQPNVPRDLSTICLKCLQKSPQQRYATAQHLADDVQRFLDGKSILARSAGVGERVLKWARRRPASTVSIMAVLVTMVGFIFAAAYYQMELSNWSVALQSFLTREKTLITKLSEQETEFEQRVRIARQRAYAKSIQQAGQFLDLRQPLFVRKALLTQWPKQGQQDLRGFAWYYLWRHQTQRFQFHGHSAPVQSIAFCPEGKRIASAANDGTVKIWELASHRCLTTFHEEARTCSLLAWNNNGRYLGYAVHGNDPYSRIAVVRDLKTKQRFPLGRAIDLWGLAFLPGQATLLMIEHHKGKNGYCRLFKWHWQSGREEELERIANGFVDRLEVSPDGKYVAVQWNIIHQPTKTAVWDLRTREKIHYLQKDLFRNFIQLPDNKLGIVFSTNNFRTLSIMDVETEKQIHSFEVPDPKYFGSRQADALSFSNSFRLLTWRDGTTDTIRLWQPKTGTLLKTIEHPNVLDTVYPWLNPEDKHVALSPDDSLLALAGKDGTIHFLAVNDLQGYELLPPPLQGGEAWSVAYSPDGKQLAVGYDNEANFDRESLKLWDARTGEHLVTLTGHQGTVMSMAYSPDGKLLATGSYDRTVKLWDPHTGELQKILMGHTQPVRTVAFSPTGKWLASAGSDTTIRVWDVHRRKLHRVLKGHQLNVRSVAFNANDKWLVSTSNDQSVRLWNPVTGDLVWTHHCNHETKAVALSPDGKYVLVGRSDGPIEILDWTDRRLVCQLVGHKAEVHSLVFSPDGRTLASGGLDGKVMLWQTATWLKLLELKTTGARINDLAFSPDNQTLSAASHDGTVILWRAFRQMDTRQLAIKTETKKGTVTTKTSKEIETILDLAEKITTYQDKVRPTQHTRLRQLLNAAGTAVLQKSLEQMDRNALQVALQAMDRPTLARAIPVIDIPTFMMAIDSMDHAMRKVTREILNDFYQKQSSPDRGITQDGTVYVLTRYRHVLIRRAFGKENDWRQMPGTATVLAEVDRLLFALREDNRVYRYRDDRGWHPMSSHTLHMVSVQGNLFTLRKNNEVHHYREGKWTKICRAVAKIARGDDHVYFLTRNGKVLLYPSNLFRTSATDIPSKFAARHKLTVFLYNAEELRRHGTTLNPLALAINKTVDAIAEPILRAYSSRQITNSVVKFGSAIVIAGTDGKDVAKVSYDATQEKHIDVNLNKQLFRFDAHSINKIHFMGYDGNDYFRNDTGIVTEADGGLGSDTLHGGTGNDTLRGGVGEYKDILHGHDGDDWLGGYGGDDILYGGRGKDVLEGHVGHDKLYGGEDADLLNGRAGNDFLDGQGGDDRLFGWEGDDTLFGGPGKDLLHGAGYNADDPNMGNDILVGDDGKDILRGGDGNDRLYGTAGADEFDAGRGTNTIHKDVVKTVDAKGRRYALWTNKNVYQFRKGDWVKLATEVTAITNINGDLATLKAKNKVERYCDGVWRGKITNYVLRFGSMLVVAGSDGKDIAKVHNDALNKKYIIVNLNGTEYSFAAHTVTKILFCGRTGEDKFVNDTEIKSVHDSCNQSRCAIRSPN